MTVPSTARRAGPYTGNGSTTTFSFTFKTFAAGDLLVTRMDALGLETTLVLNSDYSVSLNVDQDTSPGGTITYPITGSPLPAGQKLTIVGDLEYEQTTDLLGGGSFNARVIEDTFDRAVIQIQQLEERLDRALLVPVNSTANVQLPNPSANELIGWDSTGSNLQNFALSELATALAFATYRYDTFTGNGSTTQFTLSANPVTLGNLDVAVGGVTQTPGMDYLLANNVLVFTSAPPNGVTILARFGEGIASGPSMDSYDVRFRQAGTGPVDRSAESKMRDVVSLKDFGAVGDGVTDDTVAWQTAVVFAATNHKALFVPDGMYIVNSKAVLDGIDTPFQHVRIFGNARSTGPAADYQPQKAGATIFTNGGGALEVWFKAFNNESISVEGINFVDAAAYSSPSVWATTPAIKIKKGNPAGSGRYITNNNFSDIAVAGYEDPIVFQGMYPNTSFTYLFNFIGPTHFHRYYPYKCGTGLVLANCTMNRFRMSESLLFGLSAGGIVLREDGDLASGTGTAGLLFGSFDMVHFEGVKGCFRIPGGLDSLITDAKCQLTLRDVTREFCGVFGPDPITGFATGDPFGINSPVDIVFAGRVDPSIAYGEDRPVNLPANSSVSSQSKIYLRLIDGQGTTEILTPDTVNCIDQTFNVAAGGTLNKTIVVAEGAGIDFDADVEIVLSGGAYGVKRVHTYGRTSGSITRDVTGTTGITVNLSNSANPGDMITIEVINGSLFTIATRIRMTTRSCIQTYIL